MKKFRFKKIDAFATTNSEGNPAGCVYLDSPADITAGEMQRIAYELKGYVNEVGFLSTISTNELDLKFYSSEREVDFCGHATIAIIYDLARTDQSLGQCGTITLKTNRGILRAENRLNDEDAVFIMAPEPEEKKLTQGIDEIAQNLGISRNALDTGYPVSVINAGLNTLLVPLKDLQSILGIAPDLETLKNFCLGSGIDIIEVFTSQVRDRASDYRVRVFAPTFGYLEDPATGSGNSAFGCYLMGLGIFERPTITIEQNGTMDRFNIIKLQKGRDEKGNERIFFGGGAITRLEGEYLLH